MTIRWGILGAARIAEGRLLPAMMAVTGSSVEAIASRSVDRAAALTERFGGRACASYEEILGDPNVDAVYIPLPNHLHAEWATRALQAGKHVLLEKPATLAVADAEALVALAARQDRLLVEAFMYRFHPQWSYIAAYVSEQLEAAPGNGALLRAQMGFHHDRDGNAGDYRLVAAYGGGALLDVGCYPTDAATLLFGEAAKAHNVSLPLPGTDVDAVTVALLEFGRSRLATFEADFRFDETDAPLEIRFADRVLIVDRPFYAVDPGPRTVRVVAAGKTLDTRTYDALDSYAAMIGEFAGQFEGGAGSEFAKHQASQLVSSARNRALLIAAR